MINTILTILLIFAISGIFKAYGLAFQLSVKNSELDKQNQNFGKRLIEGLLKNSNEFLASMMIGQMLSLTILVFILQNTHIESLTDIATIVTTMIFALISTYVVPNLLFNIHPEIAIKAFSVPILISYILFYPLAKPLFEFSVLLSRLFSIKNRTGTKNLNLSNLSFNDVEGTNKVASEDASEEFEHEIRIIKNALDFSKVKLRECAIPRNEIEAVELNSPIEKVKELFIETGFSKILVYQDTIDNIIGYVQSLDMFHSPTKILPILKNLMIVPETMPANKLLNLFLKEHKSIALVVDEFGGTFGIVTIEDIIEEIFGEIEDEHDSSDLKEEQLSDSEFIFSGRLEIDYLNQKYGLGITESDDFATIAGFILHYNEEIPSENDKIEIGKFKIEILQVHGPKIELIKIKTN